MGRVSQWAMLLLAAAACSFDTSGTAGSGDAATVADALSPACASSYTESFGSSLYRLGSDASWYEARAACEAEGARLVVIEDELENAFVLSLEGDGDIWIGMSDHQQEGTYRWLTGDVVMGGPYENWQDTQPNDSGSGEDCGEMNAGGVWNDNGCSFGQTYVCECNGAPAAEPPTWCVTRTDTDCDICGDDCTGDGLTCSGDTCG